MEDTTKTKTSNELQNTKSDNAGMEKPASTLFARLQAAYPQSQFSPTIHWTLTEQEIRAINENPDLLRKMMIKYVLRGRSGMSLIEQSIKATIRVITAEKVVRETIGIVE